MGEFCAAIVSGAEPRTQAAGAYYLRRGDWDKPVAGLPALPEPWRSQVQARLEANEQLGRQVQLRESSDGR